MYFQIFVGVFEFLSGKKAAFIEEFKPSSAPEHWTEFPGQESVAKLTDQNIDSFIKSNQQVLVMFYAPWCTHCKSAKPEFSKAAHVLAKEAPQAKLAAVDCIKYPAVFENHNIVGYPTIKYFRSGVLIGEYHHRRHAMDFVHFMLRNPKSHDEL